MRPSRLEVQQRWGNAIAVARLFTSPRKERAQGQLHLALRVLEELVACGLCICGVPGWWMQVRACFLHIGCMKGNIIGSSGLHGCEGMRVFICIAIDFSSPKQMTVTINSTMEKAVHI
eukprot:2909999-Amphidinium_carterae.1